MNDSTPTTAGVGERIAYWRRRRGISQAVLAGLVGRSKSWLEKVERGELTADRVSTLLAIANVLKVQFSDLVGGVELPPNGGGPLDPPGGIPALRKALLTQADSDPLTAADLRTRADGIETLWHRGSYEALAATLPDVLNAARVTAEHDVPGTWWDLARLYRAASSLLRRTGSPDLALLAADRAVSAAGNAADPWMVALSQRQVAFALMVEGWLDNSGAVCSDAADAIAPTNASPVEGWAMWGSLLLTEAVVAARNGDPTHAWRVLRDARHAADVVGPGRNDYEQCFGPANLLAHEVAAALEIWDPAHARRVAATIAIDDLLNPLRRADVLIDIANVHQLNHDDGAAVVSLVEAERHSPENVRYGVKAREIVGVCLRRERKGRTPGLRDLAARLKVTV